MRKPDNNPPPLLSSGSRLGKYNLIRRIAIGGMAEIYLARTTGIERFEKLVVLKRILPQYGESAEFVKMFLNEARLAATLHHPNIAQVYDIGVEDGNYFFTMEFVHGQNLREIMRKAKKAGMGFPLDNAISVVIGICAGLHRAHEKRGADGELLGIVHRDVSPSNVLVSYDGCPKIVDFGIAMAARGDLATKSQSLKGKINYMSPEQCMGEDLDRRSDIFAIGNILYELTTGKRLYSKKHGEYILLRKIVEDPITAPSSMFAEFPPALEKIILRALEKNPNDRYQTAQEMQLDLEDFAQENKLSTSAIRVARLLEQLFAKQVGEWKAARQAGESLEDHVVKVDELYEREILSADEIAASIQAGDFDVSEPDSGVSLPFYKPAEDEEPSSPDGLEDPIVRLSAIPDLEAALAADRIRRRRAAFAVAAIPIVAVALFIAIVMSGDDETFDASPATSDQEELRAPTVEDAKEGPPEPEAPANEPTAQAPEQKDQPAEPTAALAASASDEASEAKAGSDAAATDEPDHIEEPDQIATKADDTRARKKRTARKKKKRRSPPRRSKKSRDKKNKSEGKKTERKSEDNWDQKSPLLPP